jgi:uncharacterized OsmC-like protein
MVADRLEIQIQSLEVLVDANLDVRGTLLVDRSVPVGFQHMRCRIQLQPVDDADPAKVQMLIAAAEHSCVVLQTLRKGVPVEARIGGLSATRRNSPRFDRSGEPLDGRAE